jgi:hypothetical protein
MVVHAHSGHCHCVLLRRDTDMQASCMRWALHGEKGAHANVNLAIRLFSCDKKGYCCLAARGVSYEFTLRHSKRPSRSIHRHAVCTLCPHSRRQAMLRLADTDRSGDVDLAEFVAVMRAAGVQR